jgi:hypothetical protein
MAKVNLYLDVPTDGVDVEKLNIDRYTGEIKAKIQERYPDARVYVDSVTAGQKDAIELHGDEFTADDAEWATAALGEAVSEAFCNSANYDL